MTGYWVLGLIIAALAVMYLVRRAFTATRSLESVDLPLWEIDQARPEPRPNDGTGIDDTAPAVLSPPEWTPPKSTSPGARRA